MNAQQFQKQIDDLDYWDSEVKTISANYCGDEVVFVYEMNEDFDVQCTFSRCYRIRFEYYMGLEKIKPAKERPSSYFLHGFYFGDYEQDTQHGEEKLKLSICRILMPPQLELEIWCKDVIIEKKPTQE